MAALAAGAAICSCQRENLEPQLPQEDSGMVITINASLPDMTKAAFSDVDGLVWEEGDNVSASGYKSDGTAVQRGDTKAILSDSSNASFKYSTFEPGDKVWIMYNQHGVGPDKVEFNNFYANVTQEDPGILNKKLVQLISDPIEISATETSYTAKMKIVGTIMRFLVYSENGTYANESVKSVQLISSDEYIAGTEDDGTLGYDLDAGKYHVDMAGTLGDACKLYWGNTSKTIKTTLTNALSLDGVTEAKINTGIYMAVPPVTVSGYKYVVTTDQATYTFDASATSCTFSENKLKNVLLNLDSDNVKRIGNDETKGELKYIDRETIAAMNTTPKEVSFMAGTYPLTYCFAVTRDSDANWPADADLDRSAVQNRDAGVIYYNQVKISVIDDATNQAATWCSVDYRAGDTWLDCTVSDNTVKEPRTATVTLTFDDVNGYLLVDEWKTPRTFKITQLAYSEEKVVTVNMSDIGDSKEISASAHDFNDSGSLGYHVLYVNGIQWANFDTTLNYAEDVQALYKSCKFEVVDESGELIEWLQVRYSRDDADDDRVNNTHWEYKVTENNTGVVRKAIVKFTIGQPTGDYMTSVETKAVTVIQAAE